MFCGALNMRMGDGSWARDLPATNWRARRICSGRSASTGVGIAEFHKDAEWFPRCEAGDLRIKGPVTVGRR